MDKLTINSNFKFDVIKNLLVPNKYDFYIVFSRDYSRNKRGDVKPRDTLNSIFNKGTPEIKLMYIKKIKTTIDTEIENIEDTEIFGAIRKDKGLEPTNNYTGPAYLTFQSDSPFTLEVANSTKNWNGNLYYSTDLETWSEWDGTTITSSDDNKLYLRGKGNTIITGNNQDYRWVLEGSNIKCTGNIENLLDWEVVESGSHPPMASYCYTYMFYDCTALVLPPALPAITLADYCYRSMFQGCTALTSVPALPATTLATYCYQYMFQGCTSLKISSTQTGAYLYEWRIPTSRTATAANGWNFLMLSGTGGTFKTGPSINTTYYVENPPVLALSTTDFPSDYYYVVCNNINTETVDLTHIYFRTSIQALNEPDLQRFNIVTLIYCGHSTDDLSADYTAGTALVSAPALPATTLADHCYAYMFQGCTSLKISSDRIGDYQYEWRIPTSGTGTAASNWNTSMLSGTGGTFTDDPTIDITYYVENPPVVEPSATYLTFQSDSPFTLRVNDNTKHWDGTLYYSTDLETWSEWDGTTTLISGVDNKLYLRGKGNTVITGNNQNYRWVLGGSNIKCIGNIENLLDWEVVESGNHPSMGPYCYAYLFSGTIDQPDSNPFEGVNARILAQIKPETQFMTKYDPDNVAPDSIRKLQLMIEL